MITRVVMPKLTNTMTHGIILNWKLDEGDAVNRGDILAEIETDSAVMDLEAVGSGFLRHILINEGSAVQTGTVVAVVSDLDDDIEPTLKESFKLQKMAKIDPKSPRMSAFPKDKPKPPKEEALPGRKLRSRSIAPGTTSVTKEAEEPAIENFSNSKPHVEEPTIEQNTDEDMMKKTAPIEEVVELVEDVLKETDITTKKLNVDNSPAQKTFATHSHGQPYYHLTTEISMGDAERLREQMMDIQHTTLNFTTLYVRAAALALSRHPGIRNACIGMNKNDIDLGVAITLEEELRTPILRNCQAKNIAELSDEIQTLTQAVRETKQTQEEDDYPAFTIANFGMYQVEHVTPLLHSSQVASLAVGTIRNVQIPENGFVTIDRRVTISLTCHAESLEEEQAALFLKTFKLIMERPLEIFLPNPVE